MRSLLRNRDGATALEFALIAPVLVLFLIGIGQMGLVFFANAGLRNALAEGARQATLYPRPTDAQIRQRISAAKFGLDPTKLSIPTITAGTANGAQYQDITMTYQVQLDFAFFKSPPFALTETRRVYLQPLPAN